jgi:ADP-heptose:LPS heptosyltransferase
MAENKTKKIFILRNNDLGDVLVATPLIKGLRKAFPQAIISMGVGDWARPLLENNADLDEIVSINAPWHNKQNCRFPANSPCTFLEGLLYVLIAKESLFLRKQKFTHGIDVLGSRQGSWLLRRGRIRHRFGVRGYAGGDNWCEKCVEFQEDRKVTESALAFLPLLGATISVAPRPTVFLKDKEKIEADERWEKSNPRSKRIVIAPGGGFPEKCWGNDRFSKLVNLLRDQSEHQIRVIGSNEDIDRIAIEGDEENAGRIQNCCGKLSLRQSTALVSTSDFVITNSSLTMHLAGTFEIPSLTLLGEYYESAILHHKQWGYQEGFVLGKESASGINRVVSPEEAFQAFREHSRQIMSQLPNS